ncbi:MAG: hypothetical protein IKL05_02180 [Clostridia bacterium]|nr:hypothetical protein [Clostridia bacterium]
MKNTIKILFLAIGLCILLSVASLADDVSSVVDNVSVSYDKGYTTLTIDSINYTVDNFNGTAENQLAFYNADGTVSDVAVFDEYGVFTDEFKNIIWKEQVTRVIDVDGDGIVDRFVMAPKTAYKVEYIKTVDTVPTVYYKVLDGTGSLLNAPAASFTATLAKGDVFVAANLGDTIYTTVVAPVTTYATKLSTKTITLNGVGAVKYTDITVEGVYDMSFSATDVLGTDKEALYWIYNGQVLSCDLSATVASEYKIAILKEVVANDVALDPTTMEVAMTYSAVLIIDGVETTVTLKEVVVAGETKTVAQAYDLYRATTDMATGKIVYVYELVAAYTEDDGLYTLTINADLDGADDSETTDVVEGTTYVKVDAPAAIKYNATTGLYTVGDYNRVVLDDDSVIFYKYMVETGPAAGFIDLGKYTKANITAKSFEKAISDVAYLTYDETTEMYTLIATVVNGEIEGAYEDTVSYLKDGRLILYAPVDSNVVLGDDGNIYNEYVFMDNDTLTTKDAFVDTEVLAVEANDTKEGKLYGWDPYLGVYEEINSDCNLNTIGDIVIKDIITDYNIIYDEYGGFKVDETVTIWGLSKAGNHSSYTRYTLSNLADMLNVAKMNEKELQALVIRYRDENDNYIISSIIVNVIDDEGTFVEDIIFDNYFGLDHTCHPAEPEEPDEPTEPDEPSADAIKLVETTVKSRPGKSVTVPLVIADNTGLAGLQLKVSYDNGLTLEAIEMGDALTSLTYTAPGSLTANPITILLDGESADTTNGTVLTLTFKVDADAEEGEYNVSVEVVDAYDDDMETVEVSDTTLTVKVKNYLPGDVNGDGEVSARDVTTLRRYIAGGYTLTFVEEALDINGDGEVSARDITMLRRYIARGYGIELE